jgi:hypothetical protein
LEPATKPFPGLNEREAVLYYAAKSGMAQQRAGLHSPMQYWLAKSPPSSTISAIQSWKKKIPV